MKAIKNPSRNNGADANSWAHRLFLIIEQVALRESARIDEVRYCQTTLPPGLRQGRYMLAKLRDDSFATIIEVCYPLVRHRVAKSRRDILPSEASCAARMKEADAWRSDFPGYFEIIPLWLYVDIGGYRHIGYASFHCGRVAVPGFRTGAVQRCKGSGSCGLFDIEASDQVHRVARFRTIEIWKVWIVLGLGDP